MLRNDCRSSIHSAMQDITSSSPWIRRSPDRDSIPDLAHFIGVDIALHVLIPSTGLYRAAGAEDALKHSSLFVRETSCSCCLSLLFIFPHSILFLRYCELKNAFPVYRLSPSLFLVQPSSLRRPILLACLFEGERDVYPRIEARPFRHPLLVLCPSAPCFPA